MKQVIILVAFIVLGIFIGNTLILGSGNTSLKSSVTSINQRMVQQLDNYAPTP